MNAVSSIHPIFFSYCLNKLSQIKSLFPDFSYLSGTVDSKPNPSLARWQVDSDAFVAELITGKAAPVAAEQFLKDKSQAQIDELLDKVIAHAFKGEFSVEQLLNASQLMRINEEVDSISQQIINSKAGYAPPRDHSVPIANAASRTKVFSVFLPNLIDTFLKAFNILEAGKKPESVWDYSALIAIYMSALSMPAAVFGVAMRLSSTPSHALMITALVTAALLASLYVYLRWLRPLPHSLPNCKNVLDIPTPFYAERSEEMDKVMRALDAGQNIMIIGETGLGKSTLVLECGKRMTKKTMQVVSNSVFQNSYASPIDKLESDFNEAEKYPGQVVFFIDEFDKVLQDNFIHFFREKMDLKKFQFVVVCEKSNYLAKIETLRSLNGRFPLKLFATPPADDELAEILFAYYREEDNSVDIKGCAIDLVQYVISQTNQKKQEMKSREQPAAAMSVWEYAIKKMEVASDYTKYCSPKTLGLKRKIKEAQSRYSLLKQENKSAMRPTIAQWQVELEQEQNSNRVVRERIQKIQRLSRYRVSLRKHTEKTVHSFQPGDQAEMKRWKFMEWIEDKIEKEIVSEEDKLPDGISLRLNKKWIDEIIKELTPIAGQESYKVS